LVSALSAAGELGRCAAARGLAGSSSTRMIKWRAMRNRFLNVAFAIAFIGINAWFLFGSTQYFAKSPTDLVYVAAIALLGGLAAIFYFKLSHHRRYKTKRLIYGSITACFSACFVFSLAVTLKFFVISPSPYFQLTPEIIASLAGWLLLMAAFVFTSWREFKQTTKHGD